MALSRAFIEAADRLNSAPYAPLARLAAVSELRAQLDREEFRAVEEALDRGASWQAIGDALGVSRQSAWRRHHRDEKPASNAKRPSEEGLPELGRSRIRGQAGR